MGVGEEGRQPLVSHHAEAAEGAHHEVELQQQQAGGAEGGGENPLEIESVQREQRENDASSLEGSAEAAAGTEAPRAASDTGAVQQSRSASGTFMVPTRYPSLKEKSTEHHLIDIPFRPGSKAEELDAFKLYGISRTLSNFSNFSRASVESAVGDQCRICQHRNEETLMDLGCQCRGELAKAHQSCVDHWFGTRGTNKCEVCQYVATNVPTPANQPAPHFWVWRVGGRQNISPRRGGWGRFHPLWAALLILIAGLSFDVLIAVVLKNSALPVDIIIGVLLILGLGIIARLFLECWHEQTMRRNIRRMEEEPIFEDFPPEQTNNINFPMEGQASPNRPSLSPEIAQQQRATDAPPVTASVAPATTPDGENPTTI